MNPSTRAVCLIAAMCAATTPVMSQTAKDMPKPPAARKVAKVTEAHGRKLADDYYWLREKSSPDVVAYLEAENAYADSIMKPTEALQATLYKEMLSRIQETDANVPYRDGDYFYYSRTEAGKQYPIFARKRGSLEAKEEITVDLNELGKNEKFIALGAYAVSSDGHLLAYSVDTTGFREYELFVKDLRTGEILPDRLGKVRQAIWATDNKTLFYVVEDHAKRPYRVYRHTLGDEKAKDELVYEEKDEIFRVSAYRSRSRGYVFIGSTSFTTTEYHYVPASRPAEPLRLISARAHGHEYYPDHRGDLFYIRSNDGGRRNFRLVTAAAADPRKENWKEIVPHRADVMLEDVDLFANFLVRSERRDGLQVLSITDLRDGKSHEIELPEPVYSASVGQNVEFETDTLRFGYQSFVTPSSVFDYDMKTRERELKKRQPVLGDFDPQRYVSERVYAKAADGTRVPVSLVYRKDIKRDGKAPLLLRGYGSYGVSSSVTFDSNRLSLLDRGVVFALAHIRGGGDLGKAWYEDGKLMKKKNTFTDFIAAAEHLVAEKYTSRDRLVATGGSAGGLLMGAVTNMRPDLFKAVVTYVPFVDVMNTMLDASLPLTVGEYEEWGDPNDKEAFEYMLSYSPYDNLEKKSYPSILVKTSLNDSQVMYWEPAKYVAKLRTLKTDENPLLLKTNMAGGHGGSSGRYDALKDLAFDYAFILREVGIEK
jgi:oligopeptidase B